MKFQSKKSFALLFMALTFVLFAFVACGDDDDKDAPDSGDKDPTGLVGVWTGQDEDKLGNSYELKICFNADYTGWDNWGNEEKEVFTWYTEGNMLVFVYPEGNNEYDEDEYIYKVAGNQLYLYDYDEQTGEKDLEVVLTRK